MGFQLAFDNSFFWSALGGLASLTAIMGFYIWLAPSSMIEKLNEKFLLSETRVGYALLKFSNRRFSLPWHETIIKLLDNLFGEKLFSAKSFTRTNIHSFIVCIAIMYAMMLMNALAGNKAQTEVSTSVLVVSGPLFALGIVSANIVTDFLAVGVCRWSMIKTKDSSISRVICSVVFMFLVCTILGIISIFFKETQITWAEFVWKQYDESMGRNPNVAFVQHVMAFLTTFSVILWIIFFLLLRALTGFLALILSFVQIPAGLSPVIDHPLRCLAMFTVTLALILILVSSVKVVS